MTLQPLRGHFQVRVKNKKTLKTIQFYFDLHLKMALERLKRRDFLVLTFFYAFALANPC